MIARTPKDKCLLCGINDATKTGSHFVPEHLLRSSIGNRGYEAVGEIDLETGKSEKVYGLSRLDNPSTEKRHIPHVADYIFCPICEDRLGKLETEIGSMISQKLLNPNQKQNFPEKNIGSIQYKECLKVNGNVFGLYTYSVIYRILLQQALSGVGGVLSPEFVQVIQRFITDNIDKDLKAVELELPYKFIFMVCLERTKEEFSNVHPNLIDSNPFLFFVGNFLVLIEHEDFIKSDSIIPFPVEILDPLLMNGTSNYIPKIVLITKEQGDKIYDHLLLIAKNL